MEIEFRAPHAIDATLSPWPRRLDDLTHWLISTQVARTAESSRRTPSSCTCYMPWRTFLAARRKEAPSRRYRLDVDARLFRCAADGTGR